MKTVKELLEEFSREVVKLTDLKKKYKVNTKGQRIESIKIVDTFNEDIVEFLSSYFKSVPKTNWLNNVCFISFLQYGRKREILLYASKLKRSKVDITTFPFQDELDQPWRTNMLTRPDACKRKIDQSSSRIDKRIRTAPSIQPLIPLIPPLISFQSLPLIPLEMMLLAARERVDRLLSCSSSTQIDLKTKKNLS